MTGLYLILLIIGIELFCTIFFNKVWLRGGLFASIILGVISLLILTALQMRGNGEENFVMDAFFILNMLLPLLFSIEIHLFADKLEKRALKKRK